MKQKIKELLQKAEVYHDTNLSVDFTRDDTPLEQLITLVIQECANFIFDSDEEEHPTCIVMSRQLKDHFGINK